MADGEALEPLNQLEHSWCHFDGGSGLGCADGLAALNFLNKPGEELRIKSRNHIEEPALASLPHGITGQVGLDGGIILHLIYNQLLGDCLGKRHLNRANLKSVEYSDSLGENALKVIHRAVVLRWEVHLGPVDQLRVEHVLRVELTLKLL